jgi:hypothetical protein
MNWQQQLEFIKQSNITSECNSKNLLMPGKYRLNSGNIDLSYSCITFLDFLAGK